jgi:hypothetical protein
MVVQVPNLVMFVHNCVFGWHKFAGMSCIIKNCYLVNLCFFLQLFDLLGFDRFELIQSLLEHRGDIIYSASVAERKLLASRSGKVVMLDERNSVALLWP